MAKHPVPKKKASDRRSKLRHASFKTKALKNLSGVATLKTCPDCGQKRLAHTVCPECGKYRGRQVIDKQKKVDKITKVKA